MIPCPGCLWTRGEFTQPSLSFFFFSGLYRRPSVKRSVTTPNHSRPNINSRSYRQVTERMSPIAKIYYSAIYQGSMVPKAFRGGFHVLYSGCILMDTFVKKM